MNYKYIITYLFIILNTFIYSQNTDSLIFSKEQGYYTKPFELKITNTNPDNTIYYTLDGSIPTENSFIYKSPVKINYRYNVPNVISNIPTTLNFIGLNTNIQCNINIDMRWKLPSNVFKATIIRAVSYKNQKPSGKVYTYTFFVDTAMYSRYSLPVISLVTESGNLFSKDTGIYVCNYDFNDTLLKNKYNIKEKRQKLNFYKKGRQWERPVNITFFKKNGDIAFSQDAGIRIHGGESTRSYAQKSLGLYARKKYGKKFFNYELFKNENRYKQFLLEQPTKIIDALTHDIAKNLNIETLNSQPVIVFINGEYWGIHIIRDCINPYYLASKYNINKNKIDIMENRTVLYGNNGNQLKSASYSSNKNYSKLENFISDNDLANKKNYEYIKTQIDIKSYIDYQITEIYFNHWDWPRNNNRFWMSKTPNGKWKWILHDMDTGWGIKKKYNFNSLNYAMGKDPHSSGFFTKLFNKLLKNEEFKNQFINRFVFLMNTSFQTDTVLSKIYQLQKLYEPEIEESFLRWHLIDLNSFHKMIKYLLADFAINRPFYMKKYLIEEFYIKKYLIENFNLDPKYFDNL